MGGIRKQTPERCGHADCAKRAGCAEITNCCLNCPLGECKHVKGHETDTSGWFRSAVMEHQVKQVQVWYRPDASSWEIAALTGVNRRTVQNILKRQYGSR